MVQYLLNASIPKARVKVRSPVVYDIFKYNMRSLQNKEGKENMNPMENTDSFVSKESPIYIPPLLRISELAQLASRNNSV